MFVKPAVGWKRFTGFVATVADDPRFQGASKRNPVWTSEPIELVSEWRAYVAHGKILAIAFADHGGDSTRKPDENVIQAAVAALGKAGEAPAGYAIDFGVDRHGSTVLVEVNDGFSLGAYDNVDAATYWTVIAARWTELLTI